MTTLFSKIVLKQCVLPISTQSLVGMSKACPFPRQKRMRRTAGNQDQGSKRDNVMLRSSTYKQHFPIQLNSLKEFFSTLHVWDHTNLYFIKYPTPWKRNRSGSLLLGTAWRWKSPRYRLWCSMLIRFMKHKLPEVWISLILQVASGIWVTGRSKC